MSIGEQGARFWLRARRGETLPEAIYCGAAAVLVAAVSRIRSRRSTSRRTTAMSPDAPMPHPCGHDRRAYPPEHRRSALADRPHSDRGRAGNLRIRRANLHPRANLAPGDRVGVRTATGFAMTVRISTNPKRALRFAPAEMINHFPAWFPVAGEPAAQPIVCSIAYADRPDRLVQIVLRE
jgi:hypothetical protein